MSLFSRHLVELLLGTGVQLIKGPEFVTDALQLLKIALGHCQLCVELVGET